MREQKLSTKPSTVQSIEAALIASSSLIASAVANGLSRSPASRRSGSNNPSITVRYFRTGPRQRPHMLQ